LLNLRHRGIREKEVKRKVIFYLLFEFAAL
jgi:hypothetical protein